MERIALSQQIHHQQTDAPTGRRRRVRVALAVPVLALAGVLALPAAPPPAQAAPEPDPEAAVFLYPDSDHAGSAVDLYGDHAIITKAANAVVVAHHTGPGQGDWEQTTLEAPPGVKHLGTRVAIGAGRAVVTGVHGSERNLYVYRLSGANTWNLADTITLPSGDEIEAFATRMDLEGDLVAIGVANSETQGLEKAGAAYVVDLHTRTATRVESRDPIAGSRFGGGIALGDGYLAVSSPAFEGIFNAEHPDYLAMIGRIHVFPLDNLTGDAERIISHPLDPRTYSGFSRYGGYFGTSLALEEGLLYVASTEEYNHIAEDQNDREGGISAIATGDSTQGAVYAFDPATGERVGNKIIGPPHSSEFARDLDVNGGLLAASSSLRSKTLIYPYRLHIYDTKDLFSGAPDPAVLNRSQPEPLVTFRPTDPVGTYPSFGGSYSGFFDGGAALSGTHVLVGSPYWDSPTGAAHDFGPVPGAPVRGTTLEAATEAAYGQTSRADATTDAAGADGGTVRFTNGALDSGPVTVSGHTAAWDIPGGTLDAGEHEFTAVFTPPERAGTPVTVHASHRVVRAQTSLGVQADPPDASGGAEVRLAGTVKGEHGTIPTGSVQIIRDGAPLTTAVLDAGGAYHATVNTTLAPADSQMTVSYPGDVNHEPSAAETTLTYKAAPSPTQTPCDTCQPCADPPGCGGGGSGGAGGSSGQGGRGGQTGSGTARGTLPFTGWTSGWAALAAAGLIGAGLVLARHRRHRQRHCSGV